MALHKEAWFAVAWVGALALASAQAPPPTPKGRRKLGLGVTAGGLEPGAAFSIAQQAKLEFVEFALNWDDVEPRPGAFNGEWLPLANDYYPSVHVAVVVALNPLDTTRVALPADLRGRPYDAPEVIARYTRLVDFVLDGIPKAEVLAFSVGNEVDGVLGEDPQAWAQYTRFFKAVAGHVRARLPGVPVGCKVMASTLLGKRRALPQALNEQADAVFLTYYPLSEASQARPPAVVHDDLGALAAAYPGRALYLLEAGYPSGEAAGSSPAQQAAFVRELFAAWDRHRERLRAVNFVWLHDLSPAEARGVTRGLGSSSPALEAFLGSLGLRTHAGKDKPAWSELKRQARARGW